MRPQLLTSILLGVTALTLAPLASQAQTVLVSDSFSRNGALNGSSASIGGTWTASAAFNTDGSILTQSTAGSSANIGFTFTSGYIYSLSVDLTLPSGTGGNWAAIGFSNTTNTFSFAGGTNIGATPWVLVKGTGDVQAFGGGGTANQFVNAGAAVSAAPNTHNVKLVLDTTAAQWTASVIIDSVSIGSTFTYSSNPTISRIAIGSHNATNVVFDNVLLTQTTSNIPEPSTFASLVGLGVLGFATLGRRQR